MNLLAITIVYVLVLGHSFDKRVDIWLVLIAILLCFSNSSQITKMLPGLVL